ncbi:hypothetical protein FXO37_34852 [Capsicum annuum]|nr:hypothetical protein FXO37_34852 [Capsicum annuum]
MNKGECYGGFSGKISTGLGIKWNKNCCRQVDQLVKPPSCQVHSVKVNLLKKYTSEELLRIIFLPSVQWVDRIMQLLLFLHEGVKLKPKSEMSCSSVTKTSVTYESESTTCHEDEALFGNLFFRGWLFRLQLNYSAF